MHISVSLLFLFIGSTSAKKQGAFGIFTACKKNNSLRLDCSYANCTGSPSYTCEFKHASNGTVLATPPNQTCQLFLPDHYGMYQSVITYYTCILRRQENEEVKNITINYNAKKRKDQIKICSGAPGSLLQQTPALLWPVLTVSLWRVLVTASQPT